MDKRAKTLFFLGNGIMAFVFSATSPSIHYYFVSAVNNRILAIADMVMLVLAAVVNMTIPSDKIKRWYRRHFAWIVWIDVISFFGICAISMDYPAIRMIALSFFRATTITLWSMIVNNAIQRIISGDNLTNFQAVQHSIELWCSVTGCFIAIAWENMPVEGALFAQATANLTMGITDLCAFSILKKEAYKEDEKKYDKAC